MAQILLLEDDQTIASFIQRGLEEAGMQVQAVSDGRDAREWLSVRSFDLAIVDLMVPGLDGMSLIRSLKSSRRRPLILILSARQDVQDRVQGLQEGADDYLTKPFAFAELLARVRALLRRGQPVHDDKKLVFGDLEIDLLAHKVTRLGREIELQNKEFLLLVYLVRHAEMVVSKTMIIENVWNYHFDPQTNIVEARISKLREKIDRGFPSRLIHTIKGAGYVLRQE